MGSANAKVYTITQGPAKVSPSIIIGKLFYHNTHLYILVDSHYFIARNIVQRLNLKPFKISQKFKIEMFDGDCVVSELVMIGEAIFIKGKEMLVDEIVFEMLDFDLILGMNF